MSEKRNQQKLTSEEVFAYAGSFGKFQVIIIALILFLNCPVLLQLMIPYFLTLSPKWKCVENSTMCTFNNTLEADNKRKCDMPREEWYFTEPKKYSLVTQFDIFCGTEWKLHLMSSSLFVGWALGGVILGRAADKFGRKLVIYSSFIAISIVGTVMAVMSNIYLVIACRFVIGFFLPGSFVQGFVLASEVLGAEHRVKACYFFCVVPTSFCILALKAYLINDWQNLQLVCTVPYVFAVLSYKFVPESLLWLEAKGKHKELMDTFRRIAYWNKKSIPENAVLCRSSKDLGDNSVEASANLRNANLVLQTIRLFILWLGINMILYGLQFAANDFEGSVYRDFAILGIAGMLGSCLGVFLSQKFGVKKVVLITSFGASLSCMGIAIVPSDGNLKVLRLILAMSGQLLNTMSDNVIYVWSAELYPVTTRSTAIGFFTAGSRIGAISAPWIVKGLSSFVHWLPFVLMAVPLFIGAFTAIWLPARFEISADNNIVEEETSV